VAKRNAFDDALTDEQQAFLKQGKAIKPKPQKKKAAPSRSSPATKEDFTPKIPLVVGVAAHYPTAGTGSVNARIDSAVTNALSRASLERRIEQKTPWMQRDIIAEALSEWLKKHGYLN
jgi:hypothetical protein